MRQLTLEVEPTGLSLSSQQRPAISRGSLTELILSEGSAVQPMQLLPLLAQCSAQQRWLMCMSPSMPMNKRYLESLGLENSAVIHLDVCADTQMVLVEKVLAAANSHIIIEWQGTLHDNQRECIQQQAWRSGSQVILIQRR